MSHILLIITRSSVKVFLYTVHCYLQSMFRHCRDQFENWRRYKKRNRAQIQKLFILFFERDSDCKFNKTL